jgi:hypothetical protein
MIAFSTLCMILVVYWITVSRKRGFKLQFPLISIPILSSAVALQGMSLLSGMGWLIPYSPTIFVFGFLFVLVFGANMFLALLYSIWE